MLDKEQIELQVANLSQHSSRLFMRRVAQQDIDVEIAQQQDPEVMKYIREPNNEAQARETFAQMVAPWQVDNADTSWATINVERQTDGVSIGSLAFRFESFDAGIVEIGYRFVPKYQGQGYATEAVTQLLIWLFNTVGVHKVVAKCDPENIGSYKLMEKLGMQREALLRQHYKIGEQYSDEYIYGLLASDPKSFL